MQKRFTDMDAQHQDQISKLRVALATGEEDRKRQEQRLSKMELMLQERQQSSAVQDLEARMAALEEDVQNASAEADEQHAHLLVSLQAAQAAQAETRPGSRPSVLAAQIAGPLSGITDRMQGVLDTHTDRMAGAQGALEREGERVSQAIQALEVTRQSVPRLSVITGAVQSTVQGVLEQQQNALREHLQAVQSSIASQADQLPPMQMQVPLQGTAEVVAEARLWHIEQQLGDVAQRLDSLRSEAHGESGWDARIQEHEVRMNAFRSKLDTVEEHWRSLDDNIRSEWESRFRDLQKTVKETISRNIEDRVRLEAIANQAQMEDAFGHAYDDLRGETGPGYGNFLQAQPAMDYQSPTLLSPPCSEPNFGLSGQVGISEDGSAQFPPGADGSAEMAASARDAVFNALDQNRDGVISRAEWNRALADQAESHAAGTQADSRRGSLAGPDLVEAVRATNAKLNVVEQELDEMKRHIMQQQILQQQQPQGEQVGSRSGSRASSKGSPHLAAPHLLGTSPQERGLAQLEEEVQEGGDGHALQISQRLTLLITKLQEVIPKVVDHDHLLTQLPSEITQAFQAAADSKAIAEQADALARSLADQVEQMRLERRLIPEHQPRPSLTESRRQSRELAQPLLAQHLAAGMQPQEEGLAESVADLMLNLSEITERVAQAEDFCNHNTKDFRDLQLQINNLQKEILPISQGQKIIEDLGHHTARMEEFGQRLACSEDFAQRFGQQDFAQQDFALRFAKIEDWRQQADKVEDLRQRFAKLERAMLFMQPATPPVEVQSPADAVFNAMDQNHDGVITRAEWNRAMQTSLQATAQPPMPVVHAGACGHSAAMPLAAMPAEGNPEEIDCLVNKVAEAETECTRIQQQLQDRISSMDKMLENMASNIFRPMSDGLPGAGVPHALADRSPLAAGTPRSSAAGTPRAVSPAPYLGSAGYAGPVGQGMQGPSGAAPGMMMEPVATNVAGGGLATAAVEAAHPMHAAYSPPTRGQGGEGVMSRDEWNRQVQQVSTSPRGDAPRGDETSPRTAPYSSRSPSPRGVGGR